MDDALEHRRTVALFGDGFDHVMHELDHDLLLLLKELLFLLDYLDVLALAAVEQPHADESGESSKEKRHEGLVSWNV